MGQNMSTVLLENEEWKVMAKQQQQEYYERLSDRDWELYDLEDFDLLRLKILFALYGPPTPDDVKIKECLSNSDSPLKKTVESTSKIDSEENKDDNQMLNGMGNSAIQEEEIKGAEKSKLGITLEGKDEKQLLEEYWYTQDQIKEAERLKSIIISIGSKDKVYIAFIFLSAKFSDKDYNLPVIRVRKTESEASYVDTRGRIYKSWSDYLSNNKLPPCAYCYPEKGSYKADEVGDVKVKYGLSPSCSLKNRITSGLDIAASVFGIGAAVIGAVAFFTPLAPPIIMGATIINASTGVYNGTRSASTLYDRQKHGEEIGLRDAESRSAWLGIAGTIVSVSAGAASAKLAANAKAGKVVSRAGKVGVKILKIGKVTVNGIGALNSAANFVEKAKQYKLDPVSILRVTTSLLFFSHTFVGVRVAFIMLTMYDQDYLINCAESLSSTNNRDTRTSNAEVIKKIYKIENKEDFMNLLETQKEVGGDDGDENGLPSVND